MNEIKRIPNFRPYNEKIVPNVYSDEEAYYKLLEEMVKQINLIIDQNNETNNNFKRLKKEINEAENWIRNEGIPENVNEIVLDLLDKGLLQGIVVDPDDYQEIIDGLNNLRAIEDNIELLENEKVDKVEGKQLSTKDFDFEYL